MPTTLLRLLTAGVLLHCAVVAAQANAPKPQPAQAIAAKPPAATTTAGPVSRAKAGGQATPAANAGGPATPLATASAQAGKGNGQTKGGGGDTTAGASDKAPSITITGKYVPSRLYGHEITQLLVTIRSDVPMQSATLALDGIGGFRVTPARFRLPDTNKGRVTVAANVARAGRDQLATEGAVVATLETDSSGQKSVLDTEVLSFEAAPGMSVIAFLVYGVIGIVFGYVARLLIKALSDVTPAQTLALAAQPAPAGLREFVLKHYYWVDFAVTVLIGFIVLASLAKDGHPPAGAGFWNTAFVSGVALGLLTNSDLLTRIK